jgi:hypothetical protein
VALASVADAGLLVAMLKSSRIADVNEARYILEAMKLAALGVVLRRPADRKSEDTTSGVDESRRDAVDAAS